MRTKELEGKDISDPFIVKSWRKSLQNFFNGDEHRCVVYDIGNFDEVNATQKEIARLFLEFAGKKPADAKVIDRLNGNGTGHIITKWNTQRNTSIKFTMDNRYQNHELMSTLYGFARQ
jgi:hypothetical protein